MRMLNETERKRWSSWLESKLVGPNYSSGYFLDEWEDNTWVLHALYERPSNINITYNEARLHDIENGEQPVVINGINLDEISEVTGNSLEMTVPHPAWKRIDWSEYVLRINRTLDSYYPPGYKTFEIVSWPLNIVPPCEGTLDVISLSAIQDVMSKNLAPGEENKCIAYYSFLTAGSPVGEDKYFALNIDEIVRLIDPSIGRVGTPNNFWPIDKSWMVYTDYDLWATLVSGPAELIHELRAHPDLECLDWDMRSYRLSIEG